MDLPIDVIPNTAPPKFRWKQVVQTPVGEQTVEYQSTLTPTIEVALVKLVGVAKLLAAENKASREREAKHLDQLKAIQAQVAILKKGKA
jgi:hypothetical protein